MRFARLIAWVVILSYAAWPVTAAPQQSDYSVKDTRRLMAEYAKCVVDRHPKQAAEALLRNVDNGTILKQYRMLIDGECLVRSTHASAKMSFSGDLYRYALADALVAREFAGASVGDLSTVPPLDNLDLPDVPRPPPASASKAEIQRFEKAQKSYEDAKAFRLFNAFGECVVRMDPSSAHALLVTTPESADEAAHFSLLQPALGECLPEGKTLTFGKVVLRGSIAVSYYRLAHAARGAGG